MSAGWTKRDEKEDDGGSEKGVVGGGKEDERTSKSGGQGAMSERVLGQPARRVGLSAIFGQR